MYGVEGKKKKITRNTIASLETRLGGETQLRLRDAANDDRDGDPASAKLGTVIPKGEKEREKKKRK